MSKENYYIVAWYDNYHGTYGKVIAGELTKAAAKAKAEALNKANENSPYSYEYMDEKALDNLYLEDKVR